MDTQNTPVHMKLWHRGFWSLSIANMLLAISVYMLLPIIPLQMAAEGNSPMGIGLSMGIFGIGVFAFGCFISYWIQRYRRNHVCELAIIGVIGTIAVLYYLDAPDTMQLPLPVHVLVRFMQGAFYGLAQIILLSTLINEMCESAQRTEADYAATWFSRFALSLGPVLALLINHYIGFGVTLLIAGAIAIAALLLIRFVNFPFRAPDDMMRRISLDRFFLPQGKWLFLNLMLMTTIVGLLLSSIGDVRFYGLLMLGFLFALVAERFAFINAELKSETITGLIMIGAAVLLMLTRELPVVDFIAPTFIGFGIGIIGSRFQMFFIKLADHCQRGTSQSTYFLSWELGISIGLYVGYGLLESDMKTVLWLSLALVVFNLLLYNFFVHNWFVKHKNR
ncbi:MAG: MFS transporter [Prevotella sp.]|nr:MFS transporter [Prevotella sp.]